MKKRGVFIYMSVLAMFVVGSNVGLAAEPTVAIRKQEGRTEALVKVPAGQIAQLEQEPVGPVKGTINVVEGGAHDVMGASSDLVGRSTDRAVNTVGSAGESAFAWLFKWLDFKGKKNQGEN
jgi:hypothetical protein